MSEQIFEELQNDGVDIASIFGGGTQSSEDNPFAEAPASQPVEDAAPPASEPVQPTPTPLPSAAAHPAPAQEPAQPPVTAPVPETPAAPVANPLQAALEAKEAQTQQVAAQSLFEKAPVFAYGSDKDPIADPAMTFEELRIAKAPDYPELGEGKRVSWSVEYGKITKQISDPKGTTIQSIKETIERSTEFLSALKKAKDKNPDCLIKPRVTAQSKGIAAFRG